MNTLSRKKAIKHLNRKSILNLFRDSGGWSIAEIAAKSNLSKPTVMKIMNYYIDKGLITLCGKGKSTEDGGKKPNIYKLNPNGGYAIGMSITAKKLSTIISNLNADILYSLSIDLKKNEEIDSILQKISSSYNTVINESGIERRKIIGLAVGVYGLTDYEKGIVFYAPRYPSWGKNIKLLEKIKKVINDDIYIIIDNIPRFQVFAEKSIGAAKNLKNIVSIFAGYGLGLGIMIEGEIKRGSHNIMGEVGHMIINPSEELVCGCGARGCFETMVSIDRLRGLLEKNKDSFPDSMLFENIDNGNLQGIEVEEILEAYKNKDKLASLAVNDVIEWFAIGLSNIILIYDPQVIVIHGIYTKAGDEFLKKLIKKTESIALNRIKKQTKIKYSDLNNKAGVLGAVTFMINKFFE